jgi:hypothetical protein
MATSPPNTVRAQIRPASQRKPNCRGDGQLPGNGFPPLSGGCNTGSRREILESPSLAVHKGSRVCRVIPQCHDEVPALPQRKVLDAPCHVAGFIDFRDEFQVLNTLADGGSHLMCVKRD